MFIKSIALLWCFCILLLGCGCAHRIPSANIFPAEIENRAYQQAIPTVSADAFPCEADAEGAPAALNNSSQDVNQRLVDSALELYQTAQDSWDRGDLESALSALDESYALIVKVAPDADAIILQQKEDLRYTIAKRIMEVYASRFSAVNGRQDAIPLVVNKHVEAELQSFQGKERTFFINSCIRSGKYRPAIVKALQDEGMPEELSWLPLIESGFQTHALSPSRALGLWQFIASTGYKFGLERNAWVDDRMDPHKSTQAAIAYLKELHGIFGDWTTALAAYNCGEGTVLRIIKGQKIGYLDNFWDLYERLPRETASYVPRFIAVVTIMRNPERFGFNLPPLDEPVQVEEVITNKQVHLKTFASNLGISVEDLKALNPELRKEVTPNELYSLKVPTGKGQIMQTRLDELPTWKPPVVTTTTPSVFHRVCPGETLSIIAAQYGTTVQAIMALNGLKKSSYIKQGWRLNIPGAGKKSCVTRRASSSADQAKGSRLEYVVKRGDTLWKIANKFGTSAKELQAINRLHTTGLSVGQVLVIPQETVDIGA